jgi:hypothetical protein
VIGWTTKGIEFGFRWGQGFSLLHVVHRLCGPPNLLSDGFRDSFQGVKRPGREADYSPPTDAEVKKTWVYISTPPYVFMA